MLAPAATIHGKTEVKIEGSRVKFSRFSLGTTEHWLYDLEQLNLASPQFQCLQNRVVVKHTEKAQRFPAPNRSNFTHGGCA